MENSIKAFCEAVDAFIAVIKKEQFVEKMLALVFVALFTNWITCMFIGWFHNPSLTQMQVIIHSLDFFEWNFKLTP